MLSLWWHTFTEQFSPSLRASEGKPSPEKRKKITPVLQANSHRPTPPPPPPHTTHLHPSLSYGDNFFNHKEPIQMNNYMPMYANYSGHAYNGSGFTPSSEMAIGPFAASGHMVHAGGQAAHSLGHPKQSDFIKNNLNFLCFGCPSGQLALQHVPASCKRPNSTSIKKLKQLLKIMVTNTRDPSFCEVMPKTSIKNKKQ